ncbi:MAG: 50S ribosomal protein L23 [Candidatus Vogelbacteria bacterium]|nr:50S ribosomal protein L23 [Candidatus Vogelbacteria bacterium]
MSKISNTIKGDRVVLSRPRVTEKATFLSGAKSPVYTFEVSPEATKPEIIKAVLAKYKVKAVKVNIVTLPAKAVIMRGRKGHQPAIKKALVFLKAGEKIES